MLMKIVSGGQTGVDRAGLDAGLACGIPVGGWCPAGRRAEDGIIPDCYPLLELESPVYAVRTEQNVVDSDATLVLNLGELADGTALTVQLARKHRKPYLVVQLEENSDPAAVVEWLRELGVKVLNIAGPRESKCSGIHESALQFVRKMLEDR
ncbi:MAG: putative molybdenum carrier protein [Geobacteraceae bacterium]